MTRLMLCFSCLYLLIAIPSAQAQLDPRDEMDKETIQDKLTYLSKHIIDSDISQIVTCYTWDGLRYPERGRLIQNEGEKRDFWHIPTGEKILTHEVEVESIMVRESEAMCSGQYTGSSLNVDGSTWNWKGRFNILWHRVDNEWQIANDFWTRKVD